MSPSRIAPYLLTAPGRERILAGTLASWDAAGWGARPVIHHDPHRDDPGALRPVTPITRLLAAYHSLLVRAVAESTAPLLLLMEDDLAFAPRFGERIAQWSALRRAIASGGTGAAGENPGLPALASFFRPATVQAERQPAPDCLVARPASVIGSQALLLTREFAARAAAEWPTLDGFQSQRLAALAARLGHEILYHIPSLVEHTGQTSAWGGFIHRTVDFGAEL